MNHNIRRTAEKIEQRLRLIDPLTYRERVPLPSFRFHALDDPGDVSLVGKEVNDNEWEIIPPRTYWGEWRLNFILRSTFQVPEDWANRGPVALSLPIGPAGDFSHPEALAYIDGAPYAACDRHHPEILLPVEWCDGRPHTLALQGWTGLGAWPEGEAGTRLLMRECEIVRIDQSTRDFVATARVTLGTAISLREDDPARGQLLNILDHAFLMLDLREPLDEKFYDTVPEAHEALRRGLAETGQPLGVSLLAAGHAHIDVAWLWTLGQTRRKAARTFHTVLRLMEQFPDFYFTQSQPQLYDYIAQDHPALFQTIAQRVAEGRWEPVGGMWVEAVCNLSGAESLARQFLLGRSYFRAHFGEGSEAPVLWLPDVFGYAWNLPQLIKEAGLEYFFTIKLSWNQYNRLPYDTFWWQGLDGTRVLTHFSTTPTNGVDGSSTYNAEATPRQVLASWRNFQQKEHQQDLLMAYGYGDGGGGPTREMLENIREMASIPGLPRVTTGRVGDFFRQVEANSGNQLPVWNGELYLEFHRGTYTTQARNKKANRFSEFQLHDAEFLATMAALRSNRYRYPGARLKEAWELVCLNQFHDVIPGSSIGAVYEESQEQYSLVERIALETRDEALDVLIEQTGADLLLVNPTSFQRSDLVFWSGRMPEGHSMRAPDGTTLLIQPAEDGCWIETGGVEPFSVTPLRFAEEGEPPASRSQLEVTPQLLENELLRVELDSSGDITRIYDKRVGREVLAPETVANEFQAFDDRPLQWDAWDIDIFYDDRMWTSEPATSIEIVEDGPLRATLEIRRRILKSDTVQRVSLMHNSPLLLFDTTIDWRERHTLLKVAFPVDVLSPVATFEVQWGNVQRPTHRNTSWDWARFESCAQKWVDLSEGDYGVSLLNDCKYGHDIRDNVIRLSLLRGPTWPDPTADQGRHTFQYALLPHPSGWNEETIAAAYALNDPLIAYSSLAGERVDQTVRAHTPLLRVDRANVVIETVKWAEDGTGVIVRLYESLRQRGEVQLFAGFPLESAYRCNLLEETGEALHVADDHVTFSIRPFQIVTLRLIPKPQSVASTLPRW